MKRTRLGAAVAVLVVLAAMSSAVATGTFAGANGRIAFTMRTETGDFDVYTMKPDGTGVVQVTNDPGRDFNPRGRLTEARSRSRATETATSTSG